MRRRILRWLSGVWTLSVGSALLVGALIVRDPWFRDVLRFSVQGVGLAMFLGGLLHADRMQAARRALGHRWLILVGRWSYSLYLWHWVVFVLARALFPAWTGPLANPTIPSPGWMLAVFVPLVSVSLGAAACSYYVIERPMLRIRRAFGSQPLMSGAPAAAPTRAPSGSTEMPA
jgi:peptidoglycan/LPS O-acetylase OafA/YrhL